VSASITVDQSRLTTETIGLPDRQPEVVCQIKPPSDLRSTILTHYGALPCTMTAGKQNAPIKRIKRRKRTAQE